MQAYAVSFTLLPADTGACTQTVTVHDAHGGLVPGATVTAQLAMPAVKMAAHLFTLPALAPGIPGAYRTQAAKAIQAHSVVTLHIGMAGGATLGPALDYTVS